MTITELVLCALGFGVGLLWRRAERRAEAYLHAACALQGFVETAIVSCEEGLPSQLVRRGLERWRQDEWTAPLRSQPTQGEAPALTRLRATIRESGLAQTDKRGGPLH